MLDDATYADPSTARRVVLCSGKVAWDAYAARDAAASGGAPSQIAVVRVEQLYPWPEQQIRAVIGRYPNASSVLWLQEEPSNMGAWSFVQPRLATIAADLGRVLTSVCRPASSSPAVGGHHAHDVELADLRHGLLAGL